MRDLNSILIEGVLLDDPVCAEPDGSPDTSTSPRYTFSIASGSDASVIPVVIYSSLALRCSKLLRKDSSIRLVGRIAQDREASAATSSFVLHVVAEHVEIRPEPSAKPLPAEVANVL